MTNGSIPKTLKHCENRNKVFIIWLVLVGFCDYFSLVVFADLIQIHHYVRAINVFVIAFRSITVDSFIQMFVFMNVALRPCMAQVLEYVWPVIIMCMYNTCWSNWLANDPHKCQLRILCGCQLGIVNNERPSGRMCIEPRAVMKVWCCKKFWSV